MDVDLRYIRQKEGFSLEKLNSHPVIIIGLGAVGRQVAMILATMGHTNLTLIDFDSVDPT